MKLLDDEAGGKTAPDGGETAIMPVETFVATVALMVLLSTMLTNEALTPPNCTAEQPVKFLPVMTMLVSGRPVAGEKLVIAGWTKKFVDVEMTFVAVLKLCVAPSEDSRMIGPVATALGAVTSSSL
ncbi:MAG TPA: hypothetical protein VFV81_01330, partial [Verrucomicrobiae bacterium]|nr:hypothetical protein [Verrucomicrobiae bacterium]